MPKTLYGSKYRPNPNSAPTLYRNEKPFYKMLAKDVAGEHIIAHMYQWCASDAMNILCALIAMTNQNMPNWTAHFSSQ